MTRSPRGGALAALTVGATGVVFGDIGTSPLYALKESVAQSGTSEVGVYGAVSMIFWALMIVVSVKYLVVLMRADNAGEGGILSLLALLPKQVRQVAAGRDRWLFIIILIGTALLFGDGVLTPAISVLSATEGLEQVRPGAGQYAVPLAVVILVALFAVQYRGTRTIGAVFGPVMVVWFTVIGALGLWRVIGDPEVLVALSPHWALEYVATRGFGALALAGAVILAVTGAEALYADMGHFGARPIRLSWTVLVGPSLVLCYLGQAAVIKGDPASAASPFFALAPAGWALPLVVLAIAATIVASQALITGVFSLARQGIQLGLLPRIRVRHKNAEHEGQIYVPLVNVMVAVLCIGCVIAFQSSAALAHAYVLAIAGTMFVTTIAFHAVARRVWGWRPWRVWPLTVVFGGVDVFFLVGTLSNVANGGWVPIVFAMGVLIVMLAWWSGYRALNAYMASHVGHWERIRESLETREISRVPGLGIYLASPAEDVPSALTTQIASLGVVPEHIIVVTVVTDSVPFATAPLVRSEIMPGVERVTIHGGYMETVDIPTTLDDELLDGAERGATYYISERRFEAGDAGVMPQWLERIFSYLHRNSQAPAAYFGLPTDRLVSLGTRVDL